MKIDIKDNEAFVKLFVDEDNNLQCAYGFNMDSPEEEDSEDPKVQAILAAVTLLSGVVTSIQQYPDQLIEIGELAIDSGDFDVSVVTDAQTQEFMDGLSDEDLDLLTAPTEGIQ